MKLEPTIATAMFCACATPLAAQGGSAPTLAVTVEGQYPVLAPDGKWIAFESRRADGIDHIFVAPVGGGPVKQLTTAREDDETPVFSPDGEHILFARRLGEGRSAHLDIFVMDADGGNVRNLSNTPDAQDDHHKYSADGKLIVFNSSRATPFSTLSDEEFQNYAWNYDIWVMNADGSSQRPLVELPGWDTYPSFSPDGETLLWRRVLATGGASASDRNSEIFVARNDGSERRNISNHPAFDGYPAFSPDGEWVVFASDRDGEGAPKTFSLYVMRPDGSDVRRLTHPGPGAEDVRPAWSADGKQIIFNRDVGGDSRIMTVRVDLAAG